MSVKGSLLRRPHAAYLHLRLFDLEVESSRGLSWHTPTGPNIEVTPTVTLPHPLGHLSEILTI